MFSVHIIHMKMPAGSGKLRWDYLIYEKFCRRKVGIVNINNDDNLCLPRALVAAKALAEDTATR